MTGKSILQNTV